MLLRNSGIAFDGSRHASLLRRLGLLSTIALVLGTAACTKKMPDVIGKDQPTATKTLEKLKLTVQVTTQQTGKQPAGTVIDQEPKAKEKLPENKTVSIVIEGPGTANNNGGNNVPPPQTAAGVAVPPVEGKTLSEAIVQLAGAGLKTSIRRIESAQQGDVVLELNPRSGTVVAADTEVIVSVPDSLVTVPSVIGAEQVQAVVQLTLKGLKVGPAKSQIQGSGAVGTVIEQLPKANEKVAIGTEIQLTVKGAAIRTPKVTDTDWGTASSNITGAGLAVAGQWDETSTRAAGTVILQRPTPGTDVAPGSEVVLTVAGKQPNLLGNIRIYATIKPAQMIMRDLQRQ